MVAIPGFIKRNYVLIEILLIPAIVGILPAVVQTKVNFTLLRYPKDITSFYFFIILKKEAYCGFILIIMSLYWITECLPISITSFLPVILFPMFGILNSNCTSRIYFQVSKFYAYFIDIRVDSQNLYQI